MSRVLAAVDVGQVSKIILEIMQEFIGVDFKTIAVDGKAICSTCGKNAKEKLASKYTNAQLNLNLWRKFALTLHKNFKELTERNKSMKSTMFSCLLNDSLLIDLLSHVCNNS